MDEIDQIEIIVESGALIGTFKRELSQREQEHLAAVIGAELLRLDALSGTAPHPVHAPPSMRSEVVRTFDPGRFGVADDEPAGHDGDVPYWEVERAVSIPGALLCPDCGRALVAGDDPTLAFGFLACGSLTFPLATEDRPCHAGCLVACGRSE